MSPGGPVFLVYCIYDIFVYSLHGHTHYSAGVEIRGQLAEVRSHLPLFLGIELSSQAWPLGPFLVEPSRLPGLLRLKQQLCLSLSSALSWSSSLVYHCVSPARNSASGAVTVLCNVHST